MCLCVWFYKVSVQAMVDGGRSGIDRGQDHTVLVENIEKEEKRSEYGGTSLIWTPLGQCP